MYRIIQSLHSTFLRSITFYGAVSNFKRSPSGVKPWDFGLFYWYANPRKKALPQPEPSNTAVLQCTE